MKTCTKCGETKPLEAFYEDKQRGGRRPSCKACKSIHYQTNRERLSEQRHAHYRTNREAIAKQHRAYYEANREVVLEKCRAYYEANRDVLNERNKARGRARYSANLESERKRSRLRYEANRETWRNYSHRYRARQLASLVDPFTAADLAAHYAAEYPGGGCAYCPGPYEHDDHIVPLSRGGAHSLENLAPACARCNLSKGAKTLPEWLGLLAA